MKLQISEQQQGLIGEILYGISGAEARSYSGRAMYGEECLGIVFDDLADAIRFAFAVGAADPDLADTLIQPRFDSMGRGIIVYWPSVAAWDGIGDEDEDEDEDED
jgi:hypothetical protein